MELGNKIKTLRLRAGLTQEMLAEELGVSFQTISKWENSVCAPDIFMLPKLSLCFGVTIDELFDMTTDQKLHRIENMLDKQGQKRPVYTDALWAIEMIYEIQEKYEEAVQTCDRLLAHLEAEFSFTEGEPVREVSEAKQRLLEVMRK